MSIYVGDLLLRYTGLNIMFTGQSHVRIGLGGNGIHFCLLTSFVFIWILQIDALVFGEDKLGGVIPKTSFIQCDRCGDGINDSVMIWGEISYYGKTNPVTVNGNLIVRESWFLKSCRF
jgi:hypothetical protein